MPACRVRRTIVECARREHPRHAHTLSTKAESSRGGVSLKRTTFCGQVFATHQRFNRRRQIGHPHSSLECERRPPLAQLATCQQRPTRRHASASSINRNRPTRRIRRGGGAARTRTKSAWRWPHPVGRKHQHTQRRQREPHPRAHERELCVDAVGRGRPASALAGWVCLHESRLLLAAVVKELRCHSRKSEYNAIKREHDNDHGYQQ